MDRRQRYQLVSVPDGQAFSSVRVQMDLTRGGKHTEGYLPALLGECGQSVEADWFGVVSRLHGPEHDLWTTDS